MMEHSVFSIHKATFSAQVTWYADKSGFTDKITDKVLLKLQVTSKQFNRLDIVRTGTRTHTHFTFSPISSSSPANLLFYHFECY